jgi:tight adherence protein C
MGQNLLVPALTFVSITALGAAVMAVLVHRSRRIAYRLPSLHEDSFAGADGVEPRSRFLQFLQGIGTVVAPGGASRRLREQLAVAGFFDRPAAAIFLGAKMLLLMLGLLAMAFLVAPWDISFTLKIMVLLMGAALLSFIPNMVLSWRLSKRKTQIRCHLPDAVDLLEICVGSGMGMDMGWNAVADEVRRVSPTLADEMLLTNLEMHLGATRANAMRHMSDRTGADEIASLVAMLLQTERFGTSLSDALRTFAKAMRESRAQKAEEAAEKMAVKLLFPMILFIFPTILIVTAGPAGITLAKFFGNG